MCNFFSGIISKNEIYFDYDFDSHEELITKFNLKEGSEFSGFNFVRVELLPVDDNVFNHNMDNWKLKIDQDIQPDWFDLEKAENEMKLKLKEVIEKRFVINRQVDEIKDGRWFFKDSTLENFWGGTLKDFRGGTLENFWGGTLQKMFNNSLIKNMNIEQNIEIYNNALILKYNENKIWIKTSKGIIENIFDFVKPVVD